MVYRGRRRSAAHGKQLRLAGESLEPRLALAYTPHMFADFNSDPYRSNPSSFYVAGDTMYFPATDSISRGLWKTDGTSAGTVRVYPGTSPSFPVDTEISFAHIDQQVFFSTAYSVDSLWSTDGTAAGTQLISDSSPQNQYPIDPTRGPLTVRGSELFFVGGVRGQSGEELWKSDGTRSGTAIVKDIAAGNAHSSPGQLTVVGNTVYFTAHDGVSAQLWRTDGTGAGTRVVTKINPNGSPEVKNLIAFDSLLYFSATDQDHAGPYLWKSDGTAEGTVRLSLDDGSGISGEDPANLTPVGNHLYFTALGRTGYGLWRIAAGATAAELVYDAPVVSGFSDYFSPLVGPELTAVGDTLYFVARDETGWHEVWKTDGTAAGTHRVKDIRPGPETSNPRELTSVNGQLFFVADDGVSGAELWTTDGTEAGTVRVRDIHSTGGAEPRYLTSFRDKLYFSAEDGTKGRELWVSDGTESGTTLLKDIDPRTHDANLGLVGAGTNVAYFFVDAQFGELWKSDGTELGTTRVHASFAPMGFVTIVGDSAFFRVDYDLWFYDSSTNTSRQLRRFADWGNDEPVLIGDQVFFVAEDSAYGDELWVSDGTEVGTRLVKDITPGAGGTYIRMMQKVGQRVFFHAYTPETGTELWTSDGTAEGTSLVKDIWPGAESPFRFDWPANTAIVDDSMYFLASDGVSGTELWKSDGTSVGTFMVKDFSPGPASTYVHSLVGAADGAYFILGGGTTGITTVWKTDGTAQGTFALSAPLPIGYAGINMIPDRRGGVYLFAFTADTLALWKVDEHGDFSYLRAVPYPASAYHNAPPTLFTIDDTLYFFEQSSLPGLGKLWQSDGTVAGTGLAFDCSHASITPVVGEMFEVNGTLFFTADDGMHGIELWTATPTPPVAGDLDGDGGVGRPDVALMLQTMLGQRPLDAASDLDGNGNATIRDLILLRNQMSFPHGDVNEDGRATLDDLSALMEVFGASSVIGPQRGDINSDGQIDLHDVVALRSSVCTSPVAAGPRAPSPAAADAAFASIATAKKRRAYARSTASAPPVALHSPLLGAVSTSQVHRARLRAHAAVTPQREASRP